MAEPTIIDIFGAGATQSATTITINKADLASVGLTASASNTAESLLAAIVLNAKSALTQTGFDTNSDQSITVERGFDSITQRDDGSGSFISVVQNQLNVNLHKISNTAISANDY